MYILTLRCIVMLSLSISFLGMLIFIFLTYSFDGADLITECWFRMNFSDKANKCRGLRLI